MTTDYAEGHPGNNPSLFHQLHHYQKSPELLKQTVNQGGDYLATVIRDADPSETRQRRSLMRLLSDRLGVNKSEVCLVLHRSTQQDGEKRWGAFLKYEYNPIVNKLLKTCGRAMFYKSEKSWRLCLNDPNADFAQVFDELNDHFQYLVDLDNAEIYESTSEVSRTVSASAFTPPDFHIMVSHPTIRNACDRWGDKALTYDSPIELWDGGTFIDLLSLPDPFWASTPFLLLRVRKSGQPRYVSYHVLAGEVEMITYGPKSKETASLFARFIGAIEDAGVSQFIEIDSDKVTQDTLERRKNYQGDFAQFWDFFDYFHSRIKGLHFAPLSSHYITLGDRGYGEDCGVYNDVMAYVFNAQRQPATVKGIQRYFGYNDKDYPVVFSSQVLPKISPHFSDAYGDFGSIQETLVHELAHHLRRHPTLSVYSEGQGYPHDLCWAVCNEVLDTLTTGAGEITPLDRDLKRYAGVIVGNIAGPIMEQAITDILDAHRLDYEDCERESEVSRNAHGDSDTCEIFPVMTLDQVLGLVIEVISEMERVGAKKNHYDLAGCLSVGCVPWQTIKPQTKDG